MCPSEFSLLSQNVTCPYGRTLINDYRCRLADDRVDEVLSSEVAVRQAGLRDRQSERDRGRCPADGVRSEVCRPVSNCSLFHFEPASAQPVQTGETLTYLLVHFIFVYTVSAEEDVTITWPNLGRFLC